MALMRTRAVQEEAQKDNDGKLHAEQAVARKDGSFFFFFFFLDSVMYPSLEQSPIRSFYQINHRTAIAHTTTH